MNNCASGSRLRSAAGTTSGTRWCAQCVRLASLLSWSAARSSQEGGTGNEHLRHLRIATTSGLRSA